MRGFPILFSAVWGTVSFVFLFTFISGSRNSLAKGRIKEFDDLLRMYGKAVSTGGELKHAISEAKNLAQSKEFNKEYSDYYIQMLELIHKTGSAKIIQKETDRLNVIITSASQQRGAEGEVEYATIRRNILGAFFDAAAEYILHGMFRSADDAATDAAAAEEKEFFIEGLDQKSTNIKSKNHLPKEEI